QEHPNRAGTDLSGIWVNSLRHGSIHSGVGASGKPGPVHTVHGVGFPVASVRPPDPAHLRPLVECITLTGAEWASEHLNFNRGEDADGIYDAGFLLPPCQNPEGACVAAASARQSAVALPVPFLVENGVSYLAPRRGELSDGMFLREVVEQADCELLLDLHNAWTNDRNGRQP